MTGDVVVVELPFVRDDLPAQVPAQPVVTTDDRFTTLAMTGPSAVLEVMTHDRRHHEVTIGHPQQVRVHPSVGQRPAA